MSDEDLLELAKQLAFIKNKDFCLPYFTSEQLYEEALDKAEVRLEEAILEVGGTPSIEGAPPGIVATCRTSGETLTAQEIRHGITDTHQQGETP